MTTISGLNWQRLMGGSSRARMNVQDWQLVRQVSAASNDRFGSEADLPHHSHLSPLAGAKQT